MWTWTFAVTVLVKTRLRVSWERIIIHLVHAQSKLFRSRNSLSQPNLSNVNGNVFYIPHITIYGSWRFTLLFSVLRCENCDRYRKFTRAVFCIFSLESLLFYPWSAYYSERALMSSYNFLYYTLKKASASITFLANELMNVKRL